MSVLGQRLTFGIPILGVVVGLLYWDHVSGGSLGMGILATVFGLGAVVEFARMNRLGRSLEIASALLVLGLLVGTAVALHGERVTGPVPLDLDIVLLALAPGIALTLVLRQPPGAESLRRAVLALFGGVYIGLPLVCLLTLGATTPWGIGWLIFLVLVVKGNDSGAYLVGRKWGRTPLTSVSPKKTREGAVGGLVVGILAALLLAALDEGCPLGLPAAAAVAVGIGIAGQLGDLVESYLKRSAGVKDSGALVPQFGGVLDLLDSILLAGPVLLAVARSWEGAWSS